MAAAERVQDLTSRRWLAAENQAIADIRTDPGRAKRPHHIPIDWRGQEWSGIDADHGNFVRAKLWKTDLSHGRMNDADFTDADLAGGSLHKSKLARTIFHNAVLAAVDLRGADLTGADLTNADLAHARLQRADLSGAILDNADLSGAIFADDDGAAAGLTQAQLDRARAEPDEPPILAAPLTWKSA